MYLAQWIPFDETCDESPSVRCPYDVEILGLDLESLDIRSVARAPSLGPLVDLQRQGAHLYLGMDGGLYRVSLEGEPTLTLYEGDLTGFAVDESHVYMAEDTFFAGGILPRALRRIPR